MRRLTVPKRTEILRRFETWGFDAKGWSILTRRQYGTRILAADRWLTEHRGVSVVWAGPKDLEAYLFSTPPTPRNRNNLRQALIGFGWFLVAELAAPINPALGLPRLREPRSIPKALSPTQAYQVALVAPRGLPLLRSPKCSTSLVDLRRSSGPLSAPTLQSPIVTSRITTSL